MFNHVPMECERWIYEEEVSSHVELLPGIPDHVTEDLIISKLSLKTLKILAPVNHPWKQAYQSRLHDRLRSLATEKEVVIEKNSSTYGNNISGYSSGYYLKSKADEFSYPLPPIPNVGTGFPKGCEFVFLDGSVYCLGGEQIIRRLSCPCIEVYVIDVAAGKREWRQCKSMQLARRWNHWFQMYGVVGIRGKIYVCGDQDRYGSYVDSIAVYDPKFNTWDEMEIQPGLSPWESVPGSREAEIANVKISSRLDFSCVKDCWI